MIVLTALAMVASPPPTAPATPLVQARATVRIVSGVRLNLHGANNPDVPPSRDTIVQSSGEPQPARLIEFQ